MMFHVKHLDVCLMKAVKAMYNDNISRYKVILLLTKLSNNMYNYMKEHHCVMSPDKFHYFMSELINGIATNEADLTIDTIKSEDK